MPQPNSSGRVVTLVAICQGNVYWADAGDTTWSEPVNNTSPPADPPLNFTGKMQSAVLNQVMFFADGVHWVLYSPLGGPVGQYTYDANSVNTWQPSTVDLLGNPITSVFPVDADDNKPTIITSWRQRILLSGLLLDPQNVFASAQADPTNFAYDPEFQSPQQAFVLNAGAPAGQVGDVVTAMIPYNNDILVVLCDHSIYYLNGDPFDGGRIDLISDAIGGAPGQSWCRDPYGNIYFVSNKTGIYVLVPGQAPQRISQNIEQLLANLDTGLNTFSLLWNDRFQGLHVFITPTETMSSIAATDPRVPQQPVTHLFYEQRTGAWWQDRFANPAHNPLCCCTFDGNLANDRVPLIGSWDGYVRSIDPFATKDDGWDIQSTVWIGPILTQDFDDMMLYEIQAILGETSKNVTYKIHIGTTAEQALKSQPIMTGIFGDGRNSTHGIRVAGHAIYIELASSNPWQMEGIRCRISGSGLGKVRRRGKY